MTELKIFSSPTYGPVRFRKMVTMSAFTFDAENELDFAHWDRAHPKHEFASLSISSEERGIFSIWLPLLRDNLDWKKPAEWEKDYHMRFLVKKKNLTLPTAVEDKDFVRWYINVQRFLVWESDIIKLLLAETGVKP